MHTRAIPVGFAVVALLLLACACGSEQGGLDDEALCNETTTKEECLGVRGCAWGTRRDGPTCFYVGDVRVQGRIP